VVAVEVRVVMSSRYERASLIVTSNKPFGKAHLFEPTCA
jgi:DNA replication protein DnaC